MHVSRLAGRVLAVGLALWCGTSSASAQLLYEQTPSGPTHNHAYWSSPVPGYPWTVLAADSFQLTESKLLSRITWWGIYGHYGQDGVPPALDSESFVIRIHADNAGQPGAALATFETGVKTTSRTATGRTQYWPYDPWATEQLYHRGIFVQVHAAHAISDRGEHDLLAQHREQARAIRGDATLELVALRVPNNLGLMRGWTNGSSPVVWYPAIEPWDDGIQGVLANAAFRLDSFAPPSHATYEQPRLNDGGGVASSPTGTEWADSFVMTAAGTVKRIIWWGGLRAESRY